ncbi:MAG: hypothetical protein GY866_39085 [Proteobacteria bacterium]|nr:hypothetical protein [Pseudomonadota bacterium]
MVGAISNREELLTYLADIQSFTMVKETSLGYNVFSTFLDFVPLKFENILPLYPLVHDITALVYAREQYRFKSVDRYPAEFARLYFDFLDRLLCYDASVRRTTLFVEKMTPRQRRIFLKFFLIRLARNLVKYADTENDTLSDIYHSQGEYLSQREYHEASASSKRSFYAEILKTNLEHWFDRVHSFHRSSSGESAFFAPRDLFLFHYYVFFKENNPELEDEDIDSFIKTLGTYAELVKNFSPYSKSVLRHARKLQGVMVPLKEDSLSAYGGYTGLRPNGELDHPESILPSELSYMDNDPKEIDLFDIHMMESRVLFFLKEHKYSQRKRRRFLVVFYDLPSMEYKSVLLPARWSFVFLAIVFQMIGLYRDVFDSKSYSFHFAFSGQPDKHADLERILDLIAQRDFPDVQIAIRSTDFSKMDAHLEREMSGHSDDYTLVVFAKDGNRDEVILPKKYDGIHQVKIVFSGDKAGSKVRFGIQGDERATYEVAAKDEAMHKINRLRDDLTLRVIAGKQHASSITDRRNGRSPLAV